MGFKHMREKELLELLSQYESEERFGLPGASKQWSDVSFFAYVTKIMYSVSPCYFSVYIT